MSDPLLFPNAETPSWEQVAELLARDQPAHDTAIHLVRHAETEFNRDGLISGRLDTMLTQKGRRKAAALEIGRPLDLVVASDLTRAAETARLFLQARDIQLPVHRDRRLSELDFGVLQGKPRIDLPAFAKGDLDHAPDGGETYRLAALRFASFVLDLRALASARRLRHVGVFTHAGILRIAASFFDTAVAPRAIFAIQPRKAAVRSVLLRDFTVHPDWRS